MRKLDLAQSQKSSRFLYVVKAYPIKSKLLKEYGFSLVSENPIPILLPGFFSDYLTDSIHFPPSSSGPFSPREKFSLAGDYYYPRIVSQYPLFIW